MQQFVKRWLLHIVPPVLLGLCCLLSVVSSATDTTNPFSFVDPVIRILPAGSQDGTGEIRLRSSLAQNSPPVLTDFEPPLPTAKMTFNATDKAKDQATEWRYRVQVEGLPPGNATQQHYVKVSYEDKDKKQAVVYLALTVSNAPASFSWSISKLPEPWTESPWYQGPACTEFTVTAKDSTATNVVLGSSTLIEQNTKAAIGLGDLSLCRVDEAANCRTGEPINLGPNMPSRLRMCRNQIFGGRNFGAGNFHGTVTLAATQKPEGDTILQNASFSTVLAKAVGFILLCIGVYGAWWSKVWARARMDRDQALMPALLMRAQLAALLEILRQVPHTYNAEIKDIKDAINGLVGQLSDSVLVSKHFLPPRTPSPFGYPTDAAAYKAYLEARNPQVLLLAVLVKDGIMRAQAEDTGSLTDAQVELVQKAIKKIDELWTDPPQLTPDKASQSIQQILLKLHTDLFGEESKLGFMQDTDKRARVVRASEFETLQLEISSISKGVWILYGVLTVLTGTVVLIFSNPGFGIPADFIFAFFWGFGLPTTVGALAPGSAASALNISVAKG